MAKKPTSNGVGADTLPTQDKTQEDIANAGTPQSPVIYSETALAADNFGDFVRAGNGVEFKVRRRVAMPSLQFLEGMTIVVRIMDDIKLGKQVVETIPGKAKMEPGHCCTVASLSGDQRVLWCGAVLRKELEEAYPENKYVGAWFHITRLAMKRSSNGFSYSPFVINEIDPPSATQLDTYATVAQANVAAQARIAAAAPAGA